MKNVQIIEKSSGHIVAEYPVIEELIDDLSEEEYIEEAWDNAVEEGLVEETNRDNYDIEIDGDIH
ncbi:hypothetical protein [Nitrosomonas supralitoralis]|uniref:Uncharacterized protein n=1 Tax=Nitrosomonas supralitoralis TaxID=2116706 RepID=A0A2P7NQS4_9PROT|nr:hypothetical protein [Nitrosomonas supralitoralis]PSJ15810.1 hypothetical protein C7H79_16985 [Nitrosomonas supralitoralis]